MTEKEAHAELVAALARTINKALQAATYLKASDARSNLVESLTTAERQLRYYEYRQGLNRLFQEEL